MSAGDFEGINGILAGAKDGSAGDSSGDKEGIADIGLKGGKLTGLIVGTFAEGVGSHETNALDGCTDVRLGRPIGWKDGGLNGGIEKGTGLIVGTIMGTDEGTLVTVTITAQP